MLRGAYPQVLRVDVRAVERYLNEQDPEISMALEGVWGRPDTDDVWGRPDIDDVNDSGLTTANDDGDLAISRQERRRLRAIQRAKKANAKKKAEHAMLEQNLEASKAMLSKLSSKHAQLIAENSALRKSLHQDSAEDCGS